MARDTGIKIYLHEIGKVDLLTREEEVELAALIQAGDEEARQQMIRANLRLVVKIAQDYAQYGLPLLDLISEGNLGLIKAVERFDPEKGGKLSTYAAWWIKQSIKRALANQSKTIRLPAHMVDKIAKMRRMEHKMVEDLGRDPSAHELAEKMGVNPGVLEHWRSVAIRPSSLDAPIGDEDSGLFGDIIKDERAATPYDQINDRQLKEEIERLITLLDNREQEILRFRYGLFETPPETLEDVGVRFNITRERVRQIQNSAVEKLRDMLESDIRPTSGEQKRDNRLAATWESGTPDRRPDGDQTDEEAGRNKRKREE